MTGWDLPLSPTQLKVGLKRVEVLLLYMERRKNHNSWDLSVISWYAIMVWFAASLFSQMAYLAINGTPYDVAPMLESLGSFAWVLIIGEIIVWLFLGFYGFAKVARFFGINIKINELTSSEMIEPQV